MEDLNSMKKSDAELQGVTVNHNNQVILKQEKTGREMPTPYLPEEIIFQIFLFLPAKVLHEVMRLVCRTWFKLIRDPIFTNSHLLQSHNHSQFGVTSFDKYFDLYSVNKDGTRSELTKRINWRFVARSVGLILTADWVDCSVLYVVNPITKQIVKLPHAPLEYTYHSHNWAFGYSPSTSKYKVVCTDYSSKIVYILTIGVDEQWRKVLVEPDIMTDIAALCTHRDSLRGVCGFICWYHKRKNYVIVLDLEEEILYKVNSPENMKPYSAIIGSERIFSIASKQKNNSLQFWEWVNFKNNGKWRKLGNLDFESRRKEINKNITRLRFVPMILKSRDEVVIWCGDTRGYFAFNLKSGMVVSPRLNSKSVHANLICMNSLVRL